MITLIMLSVQRLIQRIQQCIFEGEFPLTRMKLKKKYFQRRHWMRPAISFSLGFLYFQTSGSENDLNKQIILQTDVCLKLSNSYFLTS